MKLELGSNKNWPPVSDQIITNQGNYNMHYYQFNIGDYASHTSRLSPIEDLAYRRMLDLYYLSEQPLNGCVTDVARELGLSQYTSEVEYILSKFFIKNENSFSQKRIDLEIKKYKSNAKNKSKAGKASAKARQVKASSKVTAVEQVLNTTATDEQLNINHKPLTNNQEPLTNNKDTTAPLSEFSEELFNQWWVILPSGRKQAKNKCLPKWKKLTSKKTEDEIIRMAQGIANYLEHHAKENTPVNYIKQPIKMLNDEIWNDE